MLAAHTIPSWASAAESLVLRVFGLTMPVESSNGGYVVRPQVKAGLRLEPERAWTVLHPSPDEMILDVPETAIVSGTGVKLQLPVLKLRMKRSVDGGHWEPDVASSERLTYERAPSLNIGPGPREKWQMVTPWFTAEPPPPAAKRTESVRLASLDNDVAFRWPLKKSARLNDDAPLRIELLGGDKYDGPVTRIDLASGEIIFADGAFGATLDVGTTLNDTLQLDCASVDLASDRVSISLHSPSSALELVLRSRDGVPRGFLLHPRFRTSSGAPAPSGCTRELEASLIVSGAAVRVALARAQLPEVSLVATAKGAPLLLRTATAVNRRSVPLRWLCNDVLPIALQQQTNDTPARMVLRQSATPVVLERAQATGAVTRRTGPVYGYLDETAFRKVSRARLSSIGGSAASTDRVPVLEIVSGEYARVKPGRSWRGSESASSDEWTGSLSDAKAFPLLLHEASQQDAINRVLNERVRKAAIPLRTTAKSVNAQLIEQTRTDATPARLERVYPEDDPGVRPTKRPAPAETAFFYDPLPNWGGGFLRVAASSNARGGAAHGKPLRGDFEVNDGGGQSFRIGPYTVRLGAKARRVSKGYIPLTAGGAADLYQDAGELLLPTAEAELQLAPDGGAFGLTIEVNVKPAGAKSALIGVLKTSTDQKLTEILRELKPRMPEPAEESAAATAPEFAEKPEWTGLVLFRPRLRCSTGVLKSFIRDSGIEFAYVALSNRRDDATAQPRISGRVTVKSKSSKSNKFAPADPASDESDLTCRLDLLDIEWIDDTLARCDSRFTLTFHRFLGVDASKPTQIPVQGVLQRRPEPIISWQAMTSAEYPLLNGSEGLRDFPLKQVYLKSVYVESASSHVELRLGGHIELQSTDWPTLSGDWLDLGAKSKRIDFADLRIHLTSLETFAKHFKIDYPTLRVSLNVPHFKPFGIDGLDLRMAGLGWGRNLFDDWQTIGSIDSKLQHLFIDLDLDLGRLPELARKALGGLRVNLRFPLRLDKFKVNASVKHLGYRIGGLKKLDIDLLHFLRIQAKSINFRPEPIGDVQVPWVNFEGVSVAVLDVDLIKDADFVAFSAPDGSGKGFAALMNEVKAENDLFRLDWALFGKNTQLSDIDAKNLMELPPPDEMQAGKPSKPGITSLKQLVPSQKATAHFADRWLIAAGIDVLKGTLVGKAVFSEGRSGAATYGVALWGDAIEEWLGSKFAISLLYMKKERRSDDVLWASVTIPRFNPGPFLFTGGVVSIEWAFNGNFFLDVGFPWPAPDGGRQWNRALGAIIPPFQASGGAYFRYSKHTVASAKYLRLSAGVAVQAGLGAAFGAGSALQVVVTIGLYAIVEGDVVLETTGNKLAVRAIYMSGAVGVLVQGYGQLDIWIISIRVAVVLSAEARTQIAWFESEQAKTLLCSSDGGERFSACDSGEVKQVVIDVTFELSAKATARACIGPRGFRVCKSFTVRTSVPIHKQLRLS